MKFFPCGRPPKSKRSKHEMEALKKYEYAKATAELELVEEAKGRLIFLEDEIEDAVKLAEETQLAMQSLPPVINEEEQKYSEESAFLDKQLLQHQKESEEVAEQLRVVTAEADAKRRQQEESQYQSMVNLKNEVERLRSELNAKASQEVRLLTLHWH